MKKIAGFIVNIRFLIFLIVAIALAFSAVSSRWVMVENDLVEYLPETSETRIGQRLMKEKFFTYGSAEVMIANITVEDAEKLCEELSSLSCIKSVDFDPESTNYYNDASALYQITFEYSEDDERCVDAMQTLRDCTADYDAYIESDVENTLEETIEQEVSVIIIYIAVIVLVVLLLTTTSFGEIPVLILTFVVSMLLNNGTNFLLGKISFVSNSVTSILQLALSLDYAIMFCNHYKEEHELLPVKEAVVEALAKSVPEIGSSCLTTLGGFVAMLFMSFRLGADMSICLMKAVIISILTVFILMPGLLVLFGPLIDKTTHKTIVPNMQVLGRFAYKTRRIVPPLFLVIIIAAFFVQRNCPYVFGYGSIVTPKQNESQEVDRMIEDTFTNPEKLAVMVPTGDFEKEGRLIKELESYPEIDHISGLANSEAMDGYMVTDCITPRQFSELLDIDYSSAQLLYTAYATENDELSKIAGGLGNYRIRIMDLLLFVNTQMKNGAISLDKEDTEMLEEAADAIESGKKQLLGDDFSRIIVYVKEGVRDKAAYDCIDRMREACRNEYPNGEVYVVGELTNEYDFKKSFESDNIKVSVISILIVMAVLLFTFKSIGMPVLLILVIQGSIWINFAIPAITGEPLMFMANLVVSAIQMGANIDYAIVIGSRYMEVRSHLNKEEAIAETMRFAFPTIMTSGTILAVAGILIGGMTSEATIVGIGQSVGRGTIISMILVLFVLPQILLVGEGIVKRTGVSFRSLIDNDSIKKAALCLVLCAGIILSVPVISKAQPNGNIVEISTEDELKAFADSCRLDSRSRGKRFELTDDIVLVKYKDISIPAFSGTFDGNGHKISGLYIEAQTGNAGLFCHVMKEGKIYDLKVNGKLTADDDGLVIGGIAGKNEGLIFGCVFEGELEGESATGGIAGNNAESGTIRKCRTYGMVSAKSLCGGIAGENKGGIYTCTNCCDVNPKASEPGLNIGSIGENLIIDQGRAVSGESIEITRDIGGICGRTGGIIINCRNYGSVGKGHIGYNVGGIAGRSNGFIRRCSNNGVVAGRKDVGGIAGQAEPYTEISLTPDRVDEFEKQMDELDEAASKLEIQLGRTADSTGDEISEMADIVRDLNRDARELKSAADDKLDHTSQQLEDIMYEIDEAADDASDVTSTLSDGADSLKTKTDRFGQRVNRVADKVDKAEEIITTGGDLRELTDDIPDIDIDLSGALKKSGKEIDRVSSGIADTAHGLDSLAADIDDIDKTDTQISSPEISSSIDNILTDLDSLNDRADELNALLTDRETRETVREIRRISSDMTDILTGTADDLKDTDGIITIGTYEDLAEMTNGKITSSSNCGMINGDINAGGIAGAMAVEQDDDPEDDETDVSEIYRRRYRFYDAVTECTNNGQVTAKKNCSGGICGRQDTGVIEVCSSFGNVSCTEGSYVGGIAGSSMAEVVSCNSKGILNGCKYVGGIIGCGQDEGITGSGSTVRDCLSMVSLPYDAVFSGMIAGADKGTFLRNRFVSDTDAGIGGVSYAGKAEPVSYAVVAANASAPEEFRTVVVRFTRNGELLEERKVGYGESISMRDYPELDSGRECYGRWVNPVNGPIFKDTEIMAEDCRYVTALNSDLKRSDESSRPMFIVEGHYRNGSVFIAEETGDGEYLLRIPGDGSNSHSIRYDPDGSDISKLVITYTDEKGNVITPEKEKTGRCVKFTVVGQEVRLHIKKK